MRSRPPQPSPFERGSHPPRLRQARTRRRCRPRHRRAARARRRSGHRQRTRRLRPQRLQGVRRRPQPLRHDQPALGERPREGADAVRLQRPLDGTLEVVNRNRVGVQVVSQAPVAIAHGQQRDPMGAAGLDAARLVHPPPARGDATPAPVLGSAVVRILDVEATFRQRSALPGDTVNLAVQTDAPWLRMTLLRCGIEPEPTNSNYEMRGVQVGEPQRIDLSRYRGRRTTVPVTLERRRERRLRGAARGAVRPQGLRAADRPAAGADGARRGRDPDDDVARLQLLRPQRRRLRRHVVLAVGAEADRPDPSAPAGGRARAVAQLRPPVPPLAHEPRPPGDVYADEDIDASPTPRRSAPPTT